MATKKTNKKTKQNTSKKTSSNRQKTVDRADTIRVTEIATVAVSVILFCLAIVSGNGVWNVLHFISALTRLRTACTLVTLWHFAL